MAKVRVYELAKEFGVESKVVLAKLSDLGQFVRSASSTIEAPVVRKLKESFAESPPPAPVRKAPAAKAATKKAASASGTIEAPAAPVAERSSLRWPRSTVRCVEHKSRSTPPGTSSPDMVPC